MKIYYAKEVDLCFPHYTYCLGKPGAEDARDY